MFSTARRLLLVAVLALPLFAASSGNAPLRCLDFSPYVGNLNPSTGHPGGGLIDSLLDVASAQGFGCIMTYGVLDTLSYTFQAARTRHIKVIAIIGLDWDPANPTAARAATLNANSINAGILFANLYRDTIIRVSCGSEFVSSNVNSSRSNVGELNSAIQSCISQLRNGGVTQPIISIDTWWEWCNAAYPCVPRFLATQVDWIGVNVFPWWENKYSGLPGFTCTPASAAADFTAARLNDLKGVYGSQEVMLTEFGWPRGPDGYSETNVNTGEHCGVASEQNHAAVISQTLAKLDAANISAGIFEGFREDWKLQTEGPVGPYWGDCEGTEPYTCQFPNYLRLRASIWSPDPGATLNSQSVTFNWTKGAGADKYWLDVGNSVGHGDISAGETTATSRTVDLPTDGRTIYVRLWTYIGGTWQSPLDYVYQASDQSQMTSPAPGSTLTGTTVTFVWNAVAGADSYWLDIGNTIGHGDLFARQIAATSQEVSGLPCDGRTLYVQLWTHRNGSWQSPQRYTYSAVSGGCTVSTIGSPQQGSTFDSASVQFTWSSIAGADYYWLDVGNTLGVGDVFGRQLTGTSQLVNGIPCDGRTVYVQLWTHINGSWQPPQRYTYTAWNGCALLLQPIPGSAIGGTVTFMWTAAPAGASEYWLDVGTFPGLGNLFGRNVGTALSQRIDLPIFLPPIYVQLWSKIGGVWYLNRYTFSGFPIMGG